MMKIVVNRLIHELLESNTIKGVSIYQVILLLWQSIKSRK